MVYFCNEITTLKQSTSYLENKDNITHRYYAFRPSNKYLWFTFAMKSGMEISLCVDFVLYK